MEGTEQAADATVHFLPPAATEEANLPARLTSFVGRDDEVAALADQLMRARVVTLTGPGGVGKSRLALEALDRLQGRVVWVEFGHVTEPRDVAATVATQFGLRREPGRRVQETLGDQLKRQDLVLALDNAEHLVEDVALLVDALLRAAPNLRVLVTSREPLQVEGEITWRLAPLPSSHAVQLFVARAVQVQPAYKPSAADHDAIRAVCERIDRLPLAIELAAARMRVMTVEQISDGLEDGFRLLTGNARHVLPQQRTLEASVAWSYDLLEEPAQRALRTLSVFARDFSAAAAEAVCDEPDVLVSLVDRSLVQVVDVEPRRFRLLETVRDFARARLLAAGESESARTRHAEYFLALAEQAVPQLVGQEAIDWLSRLDEERHELDLALQWWMGCGEIQPFRRLVVALGLFWELRHPATGVRWLRTAVRSDGDDSILWAQVLWQSAHMGVYGDDLAATQRRAPRAVAAANRSGDPITIARAATTATFCIAQHDPPKARADLAESTRQCREAGDAWGVADALKMTSIACFAMGDDAALTKAVAELRSEAAALGNTFFLAWCNALEGYVATTHGESSRARQLLTSAVTQCREIGDPVTGWLTTAWLADLDVLVGERDQARRRYATTLARAGATGGTMSIIGALLGTARLRREDGDADGAAALLAPSAETLRIADPLWRSMFATEYGRCLGADGEAWLARALEAGEEIGNPGLVAAAHHGLGELGVLREDTVAAEAAYHKSLTLRVENDHLPGVLDSLDALALLRSSQRLLRATTAQRAARGIPRPPRIDQACAAVLAEAPAESPVMSLDEAIGYATRSRGSRSRATHGWASLTPTELEVVRLVAEGLNNNQIGERMFIARGTVKTHLSHVFAKLGVASRAAVAAEVSRRQTGSLPPG